jgi:hypothetical protein
LKLGAYAGARLLPLLTQEISVEMWKAIRISWNKEQSDPDGAENFGSAGFNTD